jgi:hypothetical protein
MWLTGFRSQDTFRRTFVAQGSGLTRGDRNRNERIAALRQVVRRDRAVLAIDLGEDKQAAALVDHEGRVLARRIVKAKAYQLGSLLAWAADKMPCIGSWTVSALSRHAIALPERDFPGDLPSSDASRLAV